MAPKNRPRSKSAPKAKAKAAARGSREAAHSPERDRSKEVERAEVLLRECLEEQDISRVDGRVLDIAVGQARLLPGVDAALLRRGESRLEEFLAFQTELQLKAEELRARKEEVLQLHREENELFAKAVAARKAAKERLEAVFQAVSDGDLDATRKGLQIGAVSADSQAPPPLPVDLQDHEGNTPLSEAACYGELEIVKMLLESSAHLDAQNEKGRTPLWRATYNGHEEVVKLLLEQGADPKIENTEGEPPGKYGTPATKELLSKWTPEQTSEAREQLTALQKMQTPWPKLLLEACKKGDIHSAKEVLAALRPEAVEVGGPAALMRSVLDAEQVTDALWTACCFGHADLCKVLLDARSDVDSCSETGLTCLMLACRKGFQDVVALLLERGARTFLRSTQGCLALQYAREAPDSGVAALLLRRCQENEDWSTLEEEAQGSRSGKGDREAWRPCFRSTAAASSAAATAELRAMSAEELQSGSQHYKDLLEQRALADVLGIG